MQKYITKFCKKYPEVRIKFVFEKPTTISNMIKQGTIDYGIVLNNLDISTFDSYLLTKGLFKCYKSIQNLTPEQELKFVLTSEYREVSLLKRA